MIPHPPSSTLFPYTTLFRFMANIRVLKGSSKPLTPRRDVVMHAVNAPARASSYGRLEQSGVEMWWVFTDRSEEHTSELQSHSDLVCRLLLEKKNIVVSVLT